MPVIPRWRRLRAPASFPMSIAEVPVAGAGSRLAPGRGTGRLARQDGRGDDNGQG